MKIGTAIAIGIGGVIAVTMLVGRSEEQKLEDAKLGYNKFGLVGDLGAATNRATGGVLADFGSFLGMKITDGFDFLRRNHPANVIGSS